MGNPRKRRYVKAEPDLTDAIDFHADEETVLAKDPRIRILSSTYNERLGGICTAGCQVYGLRDRPGFYYIKGALSFDGQAYWAYKCLAEFSR